MKKYILISLAICLCIIWWQDGRIRELEATHLNIVNSPFKERSTTGLYIQLTIIKDILEKLIDNQARLYKKDLPIIVERLKQVSAIQQKIIISQ